MKKSPVILSLLLMLVVVFSLMVSGLHQTQTKKSVPTKFSTTMSLRPYWYNEQFENSSESLPHYTIKDFIEHGHEIRRQGNYRKAEDIFKTALLFDSENAETIKEIGELVYMDGRFEEASNYFMQYLTLKPDAIESYTNLAVALINANKLTQAQTTAEKGLAQIEEDQPGPLFLILACVKLKTEDRDQAESFLTKAFESLGPDILELLNSKWASPLKELKSYDTIQTALSNNQDKLKARRKAQFQFPTKK